MHILCQLKDSHGITAQKLRDIDQSVRRSLPQSDLVPILDEIYHVRQTEEKYIAGEIRKTFYIISGALLMMTRC